KRRIWRLQQRLLEAARPLRECEKESCALAQFAPGPDPSSVGLNDVFDDRQAEAGPALFARACLVHAIKALENSFQRFGWNPRAVVFDEYLDLAVLERPSARNYLAVGMAVFNGVVGEVSQHLFEPDGVSADG